MVNVQVEPKPQVAQMHMGVKGGERHFICLGAGQLYLTWDQYRIKWCLSQTLVALLILKTDCLVG